MNLQELASPIRMYWDIAPGSRLSSGDYRRICGEIVENKLLSLQVTDRFPKLGEEGRTVLDALRGMPLALSYVIEPAVLDDEAIAVIQRSTIKVLYLVSRSLPELEGIARAASRLGNRPAWGISFPVSRANHQQLPDLLAWCVGNNVRFLQLPMQRLTEGEECFFLTVAEQKEMTERLQAIGRPADLTITIHDPFLWRTFFPDREFPGGGCQAANTMLYLSPDGDVYPCPVVPIGIGSLLEGTLREIIRSDDKREVRRRLLELPERCGACAERAPCKGGCRGRANVLGGTLDHHDPSCV